MTKIREKNTNWHATILGFFRDEDTENEQDSGYEEWKKENADIINLKEIANLEKMLEHKDRNKSKNKRKEQKEKVINPEEVDIQNLSTTKGYEEKIMNGKEIGE